MYILGIETSCDETGVALYEIEQGLLSHHLFSQDTLHSPYGGVVPEIAARHHLEKLLPLIEQTIAETGLSYEQIALIAYTAGPGLIGSLLIGTTVAKTLGLAWNKPTLPVHHLEAHLLTPMMTSPELKFPFLGLIISGGHTELVQAKAFGDYQLLGRTRDDAVGEAFDKVAKLLGLGYPGGAALSRLAEYGRANQFQFPRPMCKPENLEFSFSGLKTHAARAILQHQPLTETTAADLAKAFEDAVIDTIQTKLELAIRLTQINQVVLAGGVSANRPLRQRLSRVLAARGGQLHLAPPDLCTDNGAMIAHAAALQVKQLNQLGLMQSLSNSLEISAYARWDWPSRASGGSVLWI